MIHLFANIFHYFEPRSGESDSISFAGLPGSIGARAMENLLPLWSLRTAAEIAKECL